MKWEMGKIHQGDRIHNGWGKFWESTSVEKDETLCKSGNCRGVSAVWICLEKEGVDGSIRPGSAMIQLLSLPKPDGLGVVDNTADRGLALLYGYVKENWHIRHVLVIQTHQMVLYRYSSFSCQQMQKGPVVLDHRVLATRWSAIMKAEWVLFFILFIHF